MCARLTITISGEKVKVYLFERYDIDQAIIDLELPSYNVAPGGQVLAIISDGSKYRGGTLKWGFVPSWAEDEKTGYKMVNARAETIELKRTFKESFINKRCVILTDSYYEWKKEDNKKRPVRISFKDKRVFPLAGLYSSYKRSDGTTLYTCTIITTEPNDVLKSIHHRMPVILDEEAEKIWLDPHMKDVKVLKSLLKETDSELMSYYEVSQYVNNVRNNDIKCIEPLEGGLHHE
jgi:putative SOS response-associated peptidase YedK